MSTLYSRRVPARSSAPAASFVAVVRDDVSAAKEGSLRGITVEDGIEALIPVEATVVVALS